MDMGEMGERHGVWPYVLFLSGNWSSFGLFPFFFGLLVFILSGLPLFPVAINYLGEMLIGVVLFMRIIS